MANYKQYTYDQLIMVPINLEHQLQPGSLEFAIHRIVEKHLDLSIFNERYKNDETGRPAYDPKVLLKVIILAYSRGINTSRKIEAACRENVIFMALACEQTPDYSTIANFISSIDKEIENLFEKVLLVCEEQDLLGGTCFAIDGCKLRSNASKSKSGTLDQIQEKRDRLQAKLSRIIKKNKRADAQEQINGAAGTTEDARDNKIKQLEKDIERIDTWLNQAVPKKGQKKKELKSNMTDNDSAQMQSSHGTVQGYNAQALVDSKHQIIVSAKAVGKATDSDNLNPVLQKAKAHMQAIGQNEDYFRGKQLLADANYHSENNLKTCAAEGLDAYIPDNSFRSRDPRMAPLDQLNEEHAQRKFTAADFAYDAENNTCVCPAGHQLRRNGKNKKGQTCYWKFIADKNNCQSCPHRTLCIDSKKTQSRHLYLYVDDQARHIALEMLQKFDDEEGRCVYDQRISIVEPVFGNIREQKGLDRLTLRGEIKVNIQWMLYCIVHNVEKIANYGTSLA